MTNAERSSTEAQSEHTGWDDLAKGPEEVVDTTEQEQVKDAEYYKSHREALGDLASRFIQLRGGLEHSKGGTWNAELRTKVDEDGLPVRWSDLTKYLRKNPDAIDRVFNALEFADKVKEAEAADATAGEPASAPEQTVEAPAEAEPQKAEARVVSNAEYDAMSPSQKLDVLDGRIDSIPNLQEQTALWNKIDLVLKESSKDVQSEVRYARVIDSIKREEESLARNQKELKSTSMFTKEGRERRAALRILIKSEVTSIGRDKALLELYKPDMDEKNKKKAPEPGKDLSPEARQLFDKFRKVDERMTRLNSDLHMRLNTREIKMRKKWIADQEKYMENDMKSGGRDEASYADRRATIARLKREIAGYEKELEDYQKEHPDFVLNRAEKKTA